MVKDLVTFGLFIIDSFYTVGESGELIAQEDPKDQIGGGGIYCAIGARIWLHPSSIGMIVDRGHDFPEWIQNTLEQYGHDMWLFRDQPSETTRAANIYQGNDRGFEYLTPRIRLSPADIVSSALAKPRYIHFICSPERAETILHEVDDLDHDWDPITVYEPIPDRCVPEELPALLNVIDRIHIFSPNAGEGLSLLSLPQPPTRTLIEQAANSFLDFGAHSVIVRSGALGAYIKSSKDAPGHWVEAYFTGKEANRVVDVTGAGNAFLGGLVAGLVLSHGNLLEASLYATVSASYMIEQYGLPRLTKPSGSSDTGTDERWNGEAPHQRLEKLRTRVVG